MFLFFRLNAAETRYSIPERECLAEVRWLVMGSRPLVDSRPLLGSIQH